MYLDMFIEKNNLLCRHVETKKNALDIHGISDASGDTEWTARQILWLSFVCRENKITKLVFGPTPQCKMTARKIQETLKCDVETLELSPFNLGMYSGLSHVDLLNGARELALSLERFRYRVTNYAESGLAEVCCSQDLTHEIKTWHERYHQIDTRNTLFILSSSLIVKISNFLHGIYPSDAIYKNIGVANSGVLDLNKWSPEAEQWPDRKNLDIKTNVGDIVISEYVPTISPYADMIVVIYPGIFGSSRFGPYNLFNRMARALAAYGIRTAVVDPIGSGESLSLFRSSATEKRSLAEIEKFYHDYKKIVVIAHSLAANFLALFGGFDNSKKILISPILNTWERKIKWEVSGDMMSRHGLIFSSDFWDLSDLSGRSDLTNCVAFFGTSDSYVDYHMAETFFPNCHINLIYGAGHNYAEEGVSNELIAKIIKEAVSYFWDYC